MIRIGFIGRTKMLFDTISMFQKLDNFKISFIWTCKDEEYYQFGYENFERTASDSNCKFINSSSIKQHSDDVVADIVVSVNFVNVIPQSFINKFKFGILNAHAGDLPKYRGNACPNWAILNSEEEVVLTIHKMDHGLDSGPIVLKEKYKLRSNTYISEVYEWLNLCIANNFVEAVKHLVTGGPLVEQKGKALRTFPRKPDDSKLNFNADLDWNYRLIRASSKPFSGAYSYLNSSSRKVTIFRADPHLVDYDFCAVSGQIMERCEDDMSFLLAIGNDVLKVTEYSVDGCSKEDSFPIVCGSLRNRLT